MGSPVDNALDRLRQQINKSRATYVPGTPEKYPLAELRGLTILEAEALLAQAEQLREERDGWEKIAESRALYAHKQAARMGAHASAPQPTPVSGVPLAATSKASEGAEDGTGIDTRYRGRAEAAEAEVQRYREGLREISEVHHPAFFSNQPEDRYYTSTAEFARALLAGEPGWFLYHGPSNNIVGEAETLDEAQAMHAEWVKADARNATEIEVLSFDPDGGGAK